MFPSVFQQIPLPSSCTASREACLRCLPPQHPSVTSSLGLHPQPCEKPPLLLFWKISGRPLVLVLAEKAKNSSFPALTCLSKKKTSQGSSSSPRTLLLPCPKFFQLFYILSEMWGPSAAHWICMAYTNHSSGVTVLFLVCLFFSCHWILLNKFLRKHQCLAVKPRVSCVKWEVGLSLPFQA